MFFGEEAYKTKSKEMLWDWLTEEFNQHRHVPFGNWGTHKPNFLSGCGMLSKARERN